MLNIRLKLSTPDSIINFRDDRWGVQLESKQQAQDHKASKLQSFKPANLRVVVDTGVAKGSTNPLGIKVLLNHVRQNPQYTIAALSQGTYVIGMKVMLGRLSSYCIHIFAG